jgi:hypothetical protein
MAAAKKAPIRHKITHDGFQVCYDEALSIFDGTIDDLLKEVTFRKLKYGGNSRIQINNVHSGVWLSVEK